MTAPSGVGLRRRGHTQPMVSAGRPTRPVTAQTHVGRSRPGGRGITPGRDRSEGPLYDLVEMHGLVRRPAQQPAAALVRVRCEHLLAVPGLYVDDPKAAAAPHCVYTR